MTTALKTKVNQQDLKIYPSERLTQTDDGGGMPLGTPLTGALNELFQPISSIARVNGAFYAVLEYMGVLRADDEPLIGAFAAITKPPSDPTVSYLMFKATRFGESRAEILKRIEAYNIATIESNMTLMSTQAKDSRVIQVYISEDESLPFVGDVYCLRQDKAGYAKAEQYVQITRIVKSEVRTFTTGTKTFKKQVVQLEISAKLIADFVGVDYPVDGYANAPCKVRETAVADAAQYYGVKPLAAAIAKDAMQCKVTSLMEKLVPTNQISTPLIDLTAAGQTQTLFDGTASDGNVSLAINRNHSAGTISTIYFGNAVTPGTLKISGTGNGITDKGGALIYNTAQIGTIDYASGFATINEPAFGGNLSTATFHAASAELKVANTASTPIDINSQSSSYTLNIDPAPAVGTLQVSYRSLGKWYTLKDDGSGVLRGASSQHGSGNVNFTTGTAQISISNLPDIGSSILWSWGTRATYFNRANTAATAKLILQLANDTAPSSIALAWNDGVAKTAQGTVGGAITGNWTGKYDPNTKRILIDTGSNFNHPAGVLDVTVTYAKGDKTNVTIDNPLVEADGKVTIDLGDAPLMAGTVNMRYTVNYDVNSSSKSAVISVSDDGNGNIIDKDNKVIGTVNYTTAEVKFTPTVKVSVYERIYSYNIWGMALLPYTAKVTKDAAFNGGIAASFFTATPNNQVTENLKSDTIEIDLLSALQEVIAPGAVNFTWGNKTYFDRGGSLYTDLNTATGSAVTSGVINYQTGIGTLKNWSWKDGQAPFVRSLVTSIDGNPVSQATFRTPAAPIRAGSLQIRATAIDGTKITASSAYSGVITGTLATGAVDFEYGVATVKFGKKVDITDQVKQQPWYDASTDSGGKTWQPIPVFAETITYNADAYTYLPIDSGVVKIDTVRLPQDGRVPIFRRGDSILIRNAQTDNLGSAFTGGQTLNLSRKDVDRISLLDADNKPVLGELWDYDLDAGTITFKTSIDLSSYKMPLKAIHAQEQRNRVVDLDIDGTLSLLFAANRNYPTEDTYVSSLLIGDDLAVRVSVPFTQRSWNNVWQDTPVGDPLLNKLKLTDYPMILTDDGAITDRWLIKFISNAQFELYGEALGFVGKFDTLTNLAPINPATGKPYFTIDKRAFGTGTPWAAQDVIRFNTWGTLMPVWVLCAVQPNPNPPTGADGFEQYLFGDTTEDNSMNLITPERVPVTVYRWDDANAPVLDKKANCVASIFKACLVTGYGSKQPAGWSMPYENMTTNVKVIKPPVSSEKDYLMRLSADNGRAITVQMYANMSNINTGTLLLQLASPYRYNGGNYATGKWVMIASSRGFWFFTETQDYERLNPAEKQGSYLYIGDTCSNANGVKNSALTHTGGTASGSTDTYLAMFDEQNNTQYNVYGKVYDYTLNKALTTTKKSMFDGMTNLSNNIYLSQLTLYANSDFYALPAFMPCNANANNYDIVNAGLRFINHATGTVSSFSAYNCYIPIDYWEM